MSPVAKDWGLPQIETGREAQWPDIPNDAIVHHKRANGVKGRRYFWRSAFTSRCKYRLPPRLRILAATSGGHVT